MSNSGTEEFTVNGFHQLFASFGETRRIDSLKFLKSAYTKSLSTSHVVPMIPFSMSTFILNSGYQEHNISDPGVLSIQRLCNGQEFIIDNKKH
jgi:hypothetical protein